MKFAVSRPPSGFHLLMDQDAAMAVAKLCGESDPKKVRVYLSEATRHTSGGFSLSFGMRHRENDQRPVATLGTQGSPHWPWAARWSPSHATRLLPMPLHGLYFVPQQDVSLDAKGLLLALPRAEDLPPPIARGKNAPKDPSEPAPQSQGPTVIVRLGLPSGERAYRVPQAEALMLAMDLGERGFRVTGDGQ